MIALTTKIIFKLLFVLLCLLPHAKSVTLRVMKVVMSTDPHSGMDGGMFGKRWFGGGDFEMTICSSSEDLKCCETGNLNTADNNWERGETNFFIGHQLNMCNNFELSTTGGTSLKVQHYGSDGGKIQRIELRGALRHQNEWVCVVGTKLDDTDSVNVTCTEKVEVGWYNQTTNDDKICMGRSEFCNHKVNNFSFAGAHNSGTGMSGSIKPLECLFKNHDLTIPEQLDFGIRFLDFDVRYSVSYPGCEGLEVGHGRSGIYYCYGPVKHAFQQVIDWANNNPKEVVLLHFGSLYDGNTTLIPLIQEIKDSFLDTSNSVNLNKVFQTTGEWPTLGDAIKRNERIFIFIKDGSTGANVETEITDYIRAYKIDDDDIGKPSKTTKTNIASFLSTYGSGEIGSNCDEVVRTVGRLCKQLSADFVKVSTYGSPWKSLGLVFKKSNICIDAYARMCNVRVQDIMNECKKHQPVLNVILSDYPNYPSTSEKVLPDLVDEENLSLSM